MRPILHLVPNLGYHGHARQAALLAVNLPRERFAVSTISLDGQGPFAQRLKQAAIPVIGRARRRLFGLERCLDLRRILETERPALVHVWGVRALRPLLWATTFKSSPQPPIILSTSAAILRKGQLHWRDRRLFRSARMIVVTNEVERALFEAAGLPNERLRVVPPGVPILSTVTDGKALRAELGIPVDAPLMMGVGHLEMPDRFHDAVWAFEILKFLFPRACLALIGDGPGRERLSREFATARPEEGGVHFAGWRPNAAELIEFADIAVVPHRHSGGTFACLEAMAAGRAIVASDLPHLAALIRDDETGVLVPPADAPAIARAIRRLLECSEQRQRLGQAARDRVEKSFQIEQMVNRFAELYEQLS
jgi:glycosyltransferase involved in cell wall biosynthesis